MTQPKPKRRFFYDTEFIERSGHLDLVSIAIVPEHNDGPELYRVSREVDIRQANPWVREHVLDKLPPPSSWVSRMSTWTGPQHRACEVLPVPSAEPIEGPVLAADAVVAWFTRPDGGAQPVQLVGRWANQLGGRWSPVVVFDDRTDLADDWRTLGVHDG